MEQLIINKTFDISMVVLLPNLSMSGPEKQDMKPAPKGFMETIQGANCSIIKIGRAPCRERS